MKIAVMVFSGVIAPRVDIAEEVIIYDIKNHKVAKRNQYKIFSEPHLFFSSLLSRTNIKLILCGACPEYILKIIQSYGTEVILNRMGDPDEAVKKVLDGLGTESTSPTSRVRSRKTIHAETKKNV
jgi:predicted Fe-Mo cluster-binding NifX family protein